MKGGASSDHAVPPATPAAGFRDEPLVQCRRQVLGGREAVIGMFGKTTRTNRLQSFRIVAKASGRDDNRKHVLDNTFDGLIANGWL